MDFNELTKLENRNQQQAKREMKFLNSEVSVEAQNIFKELAKQYPQLEWKEQSILIYQLRIIIDPPYDGIQSVKPLDANADEKSLNRIVSVLTKIRQKLSLNWPLYPF